VGIVFKNNAKTTLSSAVNNSTTTIPVTEGSVFPAADLAGAGTFFLLTLEEDGNSPAIEIVKVTTCSGASGNINLTVVRAQEGTSATAFDSGDKAELRFTSGTIDHIRSDNTVHTNIFTTANASTTAFTLNQAVTDENDLVVFIDGVFQAHNTYTVSGTTLTLATAPASGRVVTAYSIKGLRSATNVAIATMTGDNSDTTLTLPIEPVNENSVQVFFDGVYQNKSTFSVSGTTLTFSTAPPTGVEVEAILLTQTNIDTAAILKDADGDTKVQVEESSDEDKIRFDTGGSERAIIDSTGLGIGTSSPSDPLVVSDSGASSITARFINTNADANPANIRIQKLSSSPADGDYIGMINVSGENDASEETIFQSIDFISTDVSDGSEDGIIAFRTRGAGSLGEKMRIDSSGTVFIGGTTHYSGGSNADDATLTVNGAIVKKGVHITDFDEAYVGTARGILEGSTQYQAANSPLAADPVGIGSGGNFFYVVARTVATSGSASNNYILQIAYGLTGLQYTRYSSNNGSTWAKWAQRTT